MTDEEKKEIAEFITKCPDNFANALCISEAISDAKAQIQFKFWQALSKALSREHELLKFEPKFEILKEPTTDGVIKIHQVELKSLTEQNEQIVKSYIKSGSRECGLIIELPQALPDDKSGCVVLKIETDAKCIAYGFSYRDGNNSDGYNWIQKLCDNERFHELKDKLKNPDFKWKDDNDNDMWFAWKFSDTNIDLTDDGLQKLADDACLTECAESIAKEVGQLIRQFRENVEFKTE